MNVNANANAKKPPIEHEVAVLMATYNGARYLLEQLESIENQSFSNWKLWIRDDASTDDTRKILEGFQARLRSKKVSIDCNGYRLGYAKNFLTLVCSDSIAADYFMFADQDDIWMADKVEVSIKAIRTAIPDQDTPVLYCGRTLYVDSDNVEIGMSPLFGEGSFSNALVQSLAGGNTMMLNHAAVRLLRSFGVVETVSHDWWAYTVISGAGGKIVYDSKPTIRYRQHPGCSIGENSSMGARFMRLKKLIRGEWRSWVTLHVRSLRSMRSMLSKESWYTLERFDEGRNAHLFARIKLFSQALVFRHTRLGQLSLLLALVLKKI